MPKQLFHLVMTRLLVLFQGSFMLLVDCLTFGPLVLTLAALGALELVSGALLLRFKLVFFIVLAVQPGRFACKCSICAV